MTCTTRGASLRLSPIGSNLRTLTCDVFAATQIVITSAARSGVPLAGSPG
jgi:hypothetical protein